MTTMTMPRTRTADPFDPVIHDMITEAVAATDLGAPVKVRMEGRRDAVAVQVITASRHLGNVTPLRHRIEELGGRLRTISDLGRSTTFELVVPRRPGDREQLE